MRNLRYEGAKAYIQKKWFVFPVHGITPQGLCTCGAVDCSSPGKHPRTVGGCKEASIRGLDIELWWNKWPDSNVGIVTGQLSGFFVVDIDAGKGGLATFDRIWGDRLVNTPMSRTGSADGDRRGLHILWKTTGPVKNAVNILPGIDIRGDGGYIVAPPSLHVSGNYYEWQIPPGKERLSVIPPFLQARIWPLKTQRRHPYRPDDGKRPSLDLASVDQIAEGERNEKLFRMACRLLWEGKSTPEMEEGIRWLNQRRCSQPLQDREIALLVRSASRYDNS